MFTEQVRNPRAELLRQTLPKMASIVAEYGLSDQELFKLDLDRHSYQSDRVVVQQVIVGTSLCLSGIWASATPDDKPGTPNLYQL